MSNIIINPRNVHSTIFVIMSFTGSQTGVWERVEPPLNFGYDIIQVIVGQPLG